MKLFFMLFTTTSLAFAAADPIDLLQKSWDETKSYRADFTQTVKSKGSGIDEEPTSGTLSVAKPDRLRWEDKTTKTTQLLNGKEYWDISENARRKSRAVNHYPDVSKSVAKSSLQVLAGTGKFKDFYKVKLVSDGPKEAVLQLKPKTDSGETLIAKIDKNGYVLRSLTTDSADSQVVVVFKNVKRNPTFEDKVFKYEAQPNDVLNTRKE